MPRKSSRLSPSWSAMADSGAPPSARTGHTACVLGDTTLWVFGGQQGGTTTTPAPTSRKFCRDLFALDIETERWRQIPTRSNWPRGRTFHSATAISPTRFIMLHGYVGPAAESEYTDEAWMFKADASTWQPVRSQGTPPAPRAGHTAVATLDAIQRVWMFGGTDGDRCFNDLHCLDVAGTRWELVAARGAAPEARCYHAAGLACGQIVVFGGVESSSSTVLASTHTFDVRSCEWARAPDAPDARSSSSAVACDEQLIVFGGRLPNPGKKKGSGPRVGTIMRYDAKRREWAPAEEANAGALGADDAAQVARGGHAGVRVAGRMVIVGGYLGESKWTDRTLALDLAPFTAPKEPPRKRARAPAAAAPAARARGGRASRVVHDDDDEEEEEDDDDDDDEEEEDDDEEEAPVIH